MWQAQGVWKSRGLFKVVEYYTSFSQGDSCNHFTVIGNFGKISIAAIFNNVAS